MDNVIMDIRKVPLTGVYFPLKPSPMANFSDDIN